MNPEGDPARGFAMIGAVKATPPSPAAGPSAVEEARKMVDSWGEEYPPLRVSDFRKQHLDFAEALDRLRENENAKRDSLAQEIHETLVSRGLHSSGAKNGADLIRCVADALDRLAQLERLEQAVKEHNAGCDKDCDALAKVGGCAFRLNDGSAVNGNGGRCTFCPRQYMIEVPA